LITAGGFHHERENGVGYFATVRFEGEMPRVKELHRGFWDIALERFRARREEERIIPTPNRKERRLIFSEIRLKLRI
jgi:hypothetical protein